VGPLAGRPWNVLWITLEDTSPRLGCYGDPLARTPNLDRLAAQGCRFTHAFATAGVCAPSRAAVITGMYATAIGAHHMRTTHTNPHTPELPTPYAVVPPPHVRCLPEYLRAAGYFCTNNAKTDYQFPAPRTAWDVCGRTAHWRQRAPGQPFFAVFNLEVTHESGMWPRPGRTLRTDPAQVELPPYLPDTPAVREALARHYDNLEEADRAVGRLLGELAADGLEAETIVFVWSDHGEGLPRAKRWLYDAGIRVPLLVRWPGHVPAGTVSDGLVSLLDLAPTVLSVLGLPVPPHLQGQPLLGPAAKPRTYVFSARDRLDEAYDRVRAVRDCRFKYIRNDDPYLPYLLWIPYANRHPAMEELWRCRAEGRLRPPQDVLFQYPRPAEELYDVERDPWEVDNLAGDPAYAPELERLRQALDDWRRTYGDLGDVPEAELVARWWPGGVQPRTAPPVFVPLGPGNPGLHPAPEGGTFPGPLLLQLHCATQGASIAYTFDAGEAARWLLYTQPIPLPPGRTTVRAVAVRIGYADSEERVASFTVTPGPAAGGPDGTAGP
jgi:N-sulfoglucosamine sulfohydrolase